MFGTSTILAFFIELTTIERKYTIPDMREIYVFVGENRSKTAQEKGYSWTECQKTGKPVLSAIQLWNALEKIGLNPNEQIFFNLWDDDFQENKLIPEILKEMAEDGEEIIGMGKNVQDQLKKLGIHHKEMIHPAARGKIRNKDLYANHVKNVLSEGY